MAIWKKAGIITAAITILLLNIFGLQYRHSADTLQSKSAEESKQLKLSGEVADRILFTRDLDSISMYGDPLNWDDEKNMSFDSDNDDQIEINFAISPSKTEGIKLTGSVKQKDGSWKSMNFWSSDLYRLFRNTMKKDNPVRTIKAKDFITLDIKGILFLMQEGKYIVKGSCIMDDDYVQITVCDIDEDGSIEVLASVGNKTDGIIAAIYELSNNSSDPFTYRGYIRQSGHTITD